MLQNRTTNTAPNISAPKRNFSSLYGLKKCVVHLDSYSSPWKIRLPTYCLFTSTSKLATRSINWSWLAPFITLNPALNFLYLLNGENTTRKDKDKHQQGDLSELRYCEQGLSRKPNQCVDPARQFTVNFTVMVQKIDLSALLLPTRIDPILLLHQKIDSRKRSLTHFTQDIENASLWRG